MTRPLFRSSGQYFGFITDNDFIFAWDSTYLGWKEQDFVWDKTGVFRGELKLIAGHLYILRNLYSVPPIPKIPKTPPIPPTPPLPQMNVVPIQLLIGYKDAF